MTHSKSLLERGFAITRKSSRFGAAVAGLMSLAMISQPATAAPTPQWFNIKDYGAVCDGATSSTAAYQAAEAARVAAGGGVIYSSACAAGYVITGTVNFNTSYPLTFAGDGNRLTQIWCKLNAECLVWDNRGKAAFSEVSNWRDFKLQAFSGFTPIAGIALHGDGAIGNDKRVGYYNIENLDVGQFQRGIYASKTTKGIVKDVFLRGNAYGLYLVQTGDSLFEGLSTGNNTQAAVYIDGQKPSAGAWGEGLVFDHLALNVDNNGFVINNADFVWILGSQIGSTKFGSILINNSDGVIIEGNEISNTQAGGDAISADANSEYLIISDNFFDNSINYGVVVRGPVGTIADNVFVGNGTGANDILLSGAQKYTVTGNVLRSGQAVNIAEGTGANYNIIANNNAKGNITTIAGNASIKVNNLTSVP